MCRKARDRKFNPRSTTRNFQPRRPRSKFFNPRALWDRCNFGALSFFGRTQPKGPSHTKNSTESKFTMERKIATAIAKWYGECSEMLVSLRKRGMKMVQKVTNYGGSKILRIRVPQHFGYGRALWECISELQATRFWGQVARGGEDWGKGKEKGGPKKEGR